MHGENSKLCMVEIIITFVQYLMIQELTVGQSPRDQPQAEQKTMYEVYVRTCIQS